MSKTIAIALLMVLAATSVRARAQNTMRLSGTQAPPTTQRRGGSAVAPGRRPLIGLSGVPLRDGTRHRGFGRNTFFYGGWPYFPPEYDDSYEPEAVMAAPPPAPVPIVPARPEPVPSGVLLELQGNRWVTVSSFTTASPDASPVAAAASGPSTSTPELPPAIIVYRDGHSEELGSYSIMGTTIYAKADYLTTGAWTRKILLADLDIPATVKRNHDHGVKFDLPSGPDEMILRP